MNELYFCQDCEDANRDPKVTLDAHLRCAACGSDAVESIEKLLHLARRHAALYGPLVGERGQFLLISRRVA